MERRDQVLLRDRALLKVFFHQLVFAFGDEFDQLLVRFLRNVSHVRRDRTFFALAAAAHLVGVGLHADQVHNAGKILLAADRQLEWGDGASERVGQRFEDAVGVGTLAVHAADHDHARHRDLFAVAPDALGDNFHASHAINDDQRRVAHREHHLGLVDEHVEAGRVEQVELGLAPLDRGQAGRDRHLAGNLFLVVIGSGSAVVHAPETLRGAGRLEHGGHQGGLPGMSMPDQGKVAEIGSFVNFHGLSPFGRLAGDLRGPGNEDQDRVQASPTPPAKPLMLTQGFCGAQGRGSEIAP